MTSVENKEQEEGLNLEQYGLLFLSHWHWFVGAVIVSLGIAVFYIMRTTPIYTRTAQLLIKEDKGNAHGAMQEFKELGLFSSASNIQNEIFTISAPKMMKETTKRLGLDVEMTVKMGLRTMPLYNNEPVKVTRLSETTEDTYYSMVLKFISQNEAEVSDFKYTFDGAGELMEYEDVVKAKLDGSVFKTPIGDFKIEKLPTWVDDCIGNEVRLTQYPIDAISGMYTKRLSVSLSDKQATVINLTITDEIPQRANDILNMLIDVYNENWVHEKNLVAEDTHKFISKRLESITKELGEVDGLISDYKSTNLLPDVQVTLARDMQQSSKNYELLLELNNQLSMTTFVRDHLADKNNVHALLPSNTGLPSSGIENMIMGYNQLMLERTTLVENSNANSATVLDIDRRLASQKTAILRSLDNLVVQLTKQINNIEKSEREINAQIASTPKQVLELQSVERQQKVKEALYVFLLQKREENELSKTITAWNSSIIQPPIGSKLPTSPKKSMVLLVAFVLGLVVPGGLLFLRESLNHAVRGRKDMEDMVTPLLAEIPNMAGKKHWWQRKRVMKRQVLVEKGSKDIINESFRILRTKLSYFIGKDASSQVIMLTSFNPGSGKTTIAANLAAAYALRGKRVVCVEFDLRHCSLSLMMNTRMSIGLSSYLSGATDNVDDIILKDGLAEGVDAIPVGVIPPNPAELLGSDRVKMVLDELRDRYDIIFMDCPPIDIVADANIVKEHADITLFVVRAGVMDRRALPMVDELYKKNEYNRLALILNGTSYVSSRYGNYRYGYTYGYSNGYAQGYHESK